MRILLALLLACAGPAGAQPAGAPPAINAPFERPDYEQWRARFETEGREVYDRRHAIVDAVRLRPGMHVADIGAGTGLFTRLFAERLGEGGRVYAVDIARESRRRAASIRQSLRPGASLLVVDFERTPGVSPDWILRHVRAGKAEFRREIEAAGFRFVEEVPLMKENYFLRFRTN